MSLSVDDAVESGGGAKKPIKGEIIMSGLRERGRRQLAKLAAWPGPDHDQDLPVPIKSALAHVAQIMRVPRVLIVWELYEEPFREVAIWSQDGFRYSREPPDRFGGFVAATLTRETFESPSKGGSLDQSATGGMPAGEMIDQDLRQAFSIQCTITAPFFLQVCRGRVFLLDRSTSDDHDLLLAELVATRIGVDLEHHWLRSKLQEAAVARERERLAHDLHEGILQGLAAAHIHLSLGSDHVDGCVGQRLAQTRQLLCEEQQRIRKFIESSRSHNDAPSTRADCTPEANPLGRSSD
jgi:signal transduction histidine kinase